MRVVSPEEVFRRTVKIGEGTSIGELWVRVGPAEYPTHFEFGAPSRDRVSNRRVEITHAWQELGPYRLRLAFIDGARGTAVIEVDPSPNARPAWPRER